MTEIERLRSAYSRENLNRITTWLISAYRGGDNQSILELFNRIREQIGLQQESEPGKIFALLVKLYHPDKTEYYRNLIEGAQSEGETTTRKMSHILIALKVVEQRRITEYVRPRQTEEAEWPSDQEERGYDESDFDSYREHRAEWNDDADDPDDLQDQDEEYGRDFVSALTAKEYGSIDVLYTKGILSNIEGEVDVSDYEIDDLSGVEYCTNITTLNLAHNRIEDLRRLENLTRLEELYLSDNEITSVLPLAALESLKTLDLSNNQIEDITPLTNLRNLEYLNLIGNQVPTEQLKLLRAEIIVMI